MRLAWLMIGAIGAASAADQVKVEQFSPQGISKNIRQVQVRFNDAAVDFGDPRRADPFTIQCATAGKGRWVDAQNWVYDFDREVPGGTSCQFKLKSDLKTPAGKTIESAAFNFSTGSPSVINNWPGTGRSIDDEQQFLLEFDGPIVANSLLKSAHCDVEGIKERIGARLLSAAERDTLIKMLVKQPANRHFEALRCQRKLPGGKSMNLVIDAGLAGPTGVTGGDAQSLSYQVRQDFSASLHCERSNAKSNCLPILPITLHFTAPVAWSQAQQITLRDVEGKTYVAQPSDQDTRKRITLLTKGREGVTVLDPIKRATDIWVDAVRFVGPFPEKSNLTLSLPANFKDDANRSLSNGKSFPMAVKMDAYPPLAKFSASFGIVERNAGGLLPVAVRNLNQYVAPTATQPNIAPASTGNTLLPTPVKATPTPVGNEPPQGAIFRVLNVSDETAIIKWLARLQQNEDAHDEQSYLIAEKAATQHRLPTPTSNREAEVVGIPLSKPGFNVVEIESQRLGANLLASGKAMFVRTAALSTNLAVHFKRGEENALAWVTTLDKGYLMKDAALTVRDCTGKVLWQGKSDANGLALIRQTLPKKWDCPLYVFARKGDDLGFVNSNWENGIEAWRFNLPDTAWQGPGAIHTIFDRSLLRAGETVHMKHVARKRTMLGFAAMDSQNLPNRMRIEHIGSDQQYEFPISWKDGSAESVWQIPSKATLGEYQVTLLQVQGKEEKLRQNTGTFRVGEFRVPLMRAIVKGPTNAPVSPSSLPLDIQLNYLNGGGANGSQVKLRSVLRPRWVNFATYPDFFFNNGDVSEAMKKGSVELKGRWQEDGGEYFDDEGNAPTGSKDKALAEQTLTLDKQGAARTQLADLPAISQPSEVLTELEYTDPNGEIQTSRTTIPLWTSRYVAGVRIDRFSDTKEIPITAMVLDNTGKPVANAPVQVNAYHSRVFSHRKRLVGGFYAYENQVEHKSLGVVCNTKTDTKGMAFCKVMGKESGDITVRVGTRDPDGKYAFAHAETWFEGEESAWFGGTTSDRMDVIPDKTSYNPGETAALQVRMPFQQATALIAVEREGIIEAYVQSITSQKPTVRIPIKSHFAPNMFVSVLAVRGRVDTIQPTAMIDLGKPAYRLGIASVKVGHQGQQLAVKVDADRQVYQTREKAQVKIKVSTADGKPLPKPSEVTLAAVDEGLLELAPNRSWNLLEGMMAERGYGITTATAQMQIIGRRHFGKKALPAGGGGGLMPTRELFDTLLLWKAKVVLNEAGEATVEVPLNDSLTSFRIVAVAQAGQDRFGTGSTSIRATKDLMMLSGLPPVVREGDSFRAGFTLRNTTDKPMKVKANAQVNGLGSTLAAISESLQPGEAKEIGWSVTVPINQTQLDWLVSVEEEGGRANDQVKLVQKVQQAVPERIIQATLSQLEGKMSLPVALPDDAIVGRGAIKIGARAKLADSLDGVERYMSNYWFTCLEQRASRAVALNNKAIWDTVTADLPAMLDSNGFAKFFSLQSEGNIELTAYLLSLAHERGWALPAAQKTQMESALIGWLEGRIKRQSMPWDNANVTRLTALEALSRSSKVRPNLVDTVDVRPQTWPTSSLLDWINILKRTADLPQRDTRLQAALQLLRNRLNLQGTVLAMTTDKTDQLWWAMQSADVNAVRLLLTVLDEPAWQADLPRLANGALGRQRQGHWDLTTANAWGRLAYDRFSQRFETLPVTGETQAQVNGQAKSIDWAKQPKGEVVSLTWPKGSSQLTVTQQGTGKPWLTIQSIAAVPLKQPLFTGYRIQKTISPVVQQTAGTWSRGDVMRIKLDIEAMAEMGWVAVNDPIPGGSTLLNRGLKTDSAILGQGDKTTGAWPVYVETAMDAYRAYYDWLPQGKWSIEYTVRLNNSGTFQLPPTRVEAMYAPEMFGEVPNNEIRIQ
ncbi:hypothetical protein HNQ59_003297 [Chitinivorax tropicus]|uniref:Alpha-2-macroglobulin n=1 Tax=Chitinivorax tropicus TaxID=714531 RepID=A0A840MSD4_9PROT|nr:MG2 domain-containing protein [Chitinivorax tropicus]MBB5019989.1 hypothetical protein [Chitinivorax tropicus]